MDFTLAPALPGAHLTLATDPDPPLAGPGVTYALAANGLFKLARHAGSGLSGRVPVALAVGEPLAGLAYLTPGLHLARGPVPIGLFLAAVLRFDEAAARGLEAHAAITYHPEFGYRLVETEVGEATGSRVTYRLDPGAGHLVVDLHSHHRLPAFFSATDDADDGGLAIYGVVGRLGSDHPDVRLRLGVYGHRWPVPAAAVFTARPPGCRDLVADEWEWR